MTENVKNDIINCIRNEDQHVILYNTSGSAEMDAYVKRWKQVNHFNRYFLVFESNLKGSKIKLHLKDQIDMNVELRVEYYGITYEKYICMMIYFLRESEVPWNRFRMEASPVNERRKWYQFWGGFNEGWSFALQ